MDIDYSPALKRFDETLAGLSMRGQWLFDPQARSNVAPASGYGMRVEPKSAGVPHIWHWKDVHPRVMEACEALPESFTARRALAFKNPELPRCTAQTLNMAVQAIRPREIAWAHRHTIAAIRFVIQGNENLYTVVNGIAYRMQENDLVLTPSWSWHDHHNDCDEITMWLDVLDVPFVGNLNIGFYEEFGNETQPIRNYCDSGGPALRPAWNGAAATPAEGGCRYPWAEARSVLDAFEGGGFCPYDGVLLEYMDRVSRGPTLPTLSCTIQRLPPGFSGLKHRHTSSAVYFVVRGEGATETDSTDMRWSSKDCFVVPNWCWHRHVNNSKTEEALLFSVSDAPALKSLGFYREEMAPAV